MFRVQLFIRRLSYTLVQINTYGILLLIEFYLPHFKHIDVDFDNENYFICIPDDIDVEIESVF